MIDVKSWDTMTVEEKLQFCKSIALGVNVNAISKTDWELLFDFLLGQVIGSR